MQWPDLKDVSLLLGGGVATVLAVFFKSRIDNKQAKRDDAATIFGGFKSLVEQLDKTSQSQQVRMDHLQTLLDQSQVLINQLREELEDSRQQNSSLRKRLEQFEQATHGQAVQNNG